MSNNLTSDYLFCSRFSDLIFSLGKHGDGHVGTGAWGQEHGEAIFSDDLFSKILFSCMIQII